LEKFGDFKRIFRKIWIKLASVSWDIGGATPLAYFPDTIGRLAEDL
jgi:hypothetical protein